MAYFKNPYRKYIALATNSLALAVVAGVVLSHAIKNSLQEPVVVTKYVASYEKSAAPAPAQVLQAAASPTAGSLAQSGAVLPAPAVSASLPADFFDLPAMAQTSKTSGGEDWRRALQETSVRAAASATPQDSARAYMDFLKQFAQSPAAAAVLNRLGADYARMGKYPEARQAFEQARDKSAADPAALGLIRLNMAQALASSGKADTAKAELKVLMDQPMPDALKDQVGCITTLFLAPMEYSRILLHEDNSQRAEQMLKETSDRSLALIKGNPATSWLPGYICELYHERIQTELRKPNPNYDIARSMANDTRFLSGGYKGPYSYENLMALIDRAESSRAAAAQPGAKR